MYRAEITIIVFFRIYWPSMTCIVILCHCAVALVYCWNVYTRLSFWAHTKHQTFSVIYWGSIYLLLPRLPKLPSQCHLNVPGKFSNLWNNKNTVWVMTWHAFSRFLNAVLLVITPMAKEVMFWVVLVCLSLCKHHYSTSYERIATNFYWVMQGGTIKNWWNFGLYCTLWG